MICYGFFAIVLSVKLAAQGFWQIVRSGVVNFDRIARSGRRLATGLSVLSSGCSGLGDVIEPVSQATIFW